MLKISKNIVFIVVLFFVLQLTVFCGNNSKVDKSIKNIVYKCNEIEKGLIACNTIENTIFIIDNMGNNFFFYPKNYNSQLNYPPIIVDKNSIIFQEENVKDKYLIKYNFRNGKQIWKLKTNDKIISHGYINDSIVVLGFDSGSYKKLNSHSKRLEDLYDFSRNQYIYHSNEKLKIMNNNIYILSPLLDSKSIIKINVISKKIQWETNIDYNFINFIVTEKGIFYIASNDFYKGEIGIIDVQTGKKIYSHETFPNVLTNPLLKDEQNVYYANSKGKIILFSLNDFREIEIYSSLKNDSFLGLGSSQLFPLNDCIYFIDNFKIYRINNKTNKIEFFKNHHTVGFNFIIKDSLGKYKVY